MIRLCLLGTLLLTGCADYKPIPFPEPDGNRKGPGLLSGKKGAFEIVLLKEKEDEK